MKVVILAGGFGTRLAEETSVRPKPMVEIGSMPLIWHVMKIYSNRGFKDFIICLGYKGYVIKEFFMNYRSHRSDMTINLSDGAVEQSFHGGEDWTVSLIDTGLDTMTGGRLKRIRNIVGDDTFCMTYGDGLASVDVSHVVELHKSKGRLATVTAVRPPGRFGVLDLSEAGEVRAFSEKPSTEVGWINGGFFVLEPQVFDLIEGDQTFWEKEPLMWLAENDQLSAYFHDGFWQPCDTLRDKHYLERLAASAPPPWLVL